MNVSSNSSCLGSSKPIATVMDVSLSSFGMCSSMINPQVAAATAAAMGVLTPQPCSFAPVGVWSTTKAGMLIDGKPILTNDAKLVCAIGMGKLSIIDPGQSGIVIG
jgi:hypothetical protein